MQIKTNYNLCKKVNRINLLLLSFGYATVDAGWHGNVTFPLFTRLYYIEEGSFAVREKDGKKHILNAGKWYLVPAGYSFDYECSEVMKHFYFHLKICDLDGIDILKNAETLLSLDFSNFDAKFLVDNLSDDNLTNGLILRQTVMEIILSFIEKYRIPVISEDYSQCIYKALIYIRQNLSMQLTISQIAENIFVSRSTLTKHFKKELSKTVNEFICDSVLAEAERLLMTSSISICELSQKLGFSDQFYFSRKFKEKFNCSPRDYRKNKII